MVGVGEVVPPPLPPVVIVPEPIKLKVIEVPEIPPDPFTEKDPPAPE